MNRNIFLFVLLISPSYVLSAGANCEDHTEDMICLENGTIADADDVNKNFQVLLNMVSRSSTPNNGYYDNVIVNMTPPLPYTEICFKDGFVLNDQHNISESTQGGDCLPGDIGWIIEEDERTEAKWWNAKVECLKHDMRLPEPIEFSYSCDNLGAFGLINMANGNWEWTSNNASFESNGIGATVQGRNGCQYGTWGWVKNASGTESLHSYRCAR